MKETELIKQWADNNITLIYANATSQATDIMMKAEANSTKLEYEGYAAAYANLSSQVDFRSNSALLSFMFAETLSKFTNKTNLNFGFKSPGVLINSNINSGK